MPFSILKSLRNRSLTRRLKERADQDTYPRSYVDLCRALLSQGQAIKAMAQAREGLQRFPQSEDLRDILRHTWRMTKSDEIEGLRVACEEQGTLASFEALAAIYLECEEYEEALSVADEATRRHPDSASGPLLQGRLLVRRFQKDHVANDARRAVATLQRAIELEHDNFEAHLLLASHYHHIGAISKALFHLYRALDIRPDDESAKALYEVLIALPLEKEEESTLLRSIEESESAGVVAAEGASPFTSRQTRAALLADLNRISQLNGVSRAAFVSQDLTIVAKQGESRVLADGETDPLCEIARGFRKAAVVSSRRMGIGAFQSSVLTAGDRTLQFHAAGPTVVLVESEEPSRVDVIRNECVNFVASCMRTAKGLTHA